jgi:hypothetical protein
MARPESQAIVPMTEEVAMNLLVDDEQYVRQLCADVAVQSGLKQSVTGILGNAELLLADIAREKDGKLPYGGLERVETIAALAMRMRETVRQLSHEWETRNDPLLQT